LVWGKSKNEKVKTRGKYVDKDLLEQVKSLKDEKVVIKTKSRNCLIVKEFVGRLFEVHNGKKFIRVYIIPEMVKRRHKLGMYAPTKKIVIHSGHRKLISSGVSRGSSTK